MNQLDRSNFDPQFDLDIEGVLTPQVAINFI